MVTRMNVCMRIHNTKTDGENMRPGTPTPDKHWSGMLAGYYRDKFPGHIEVAGSHEQGGGPELHIKRTFKDVCPWGFEHLMTFIKSAGLTLTSCGAECAQCGGHTSCLGDQE